MSGDAALNQTDEPSRSTGIGCGCAAATGFLIVIGLPVLFVFSFGMSPCEDGPCDPHGARTFNLAALALLAFALVIFGGVWRLVRRRRGRGESAAADRSRQQERG